MTRTRVWRCGGVLAALASMVVATAAWAKGGEPSIEVIPDAKGEGSGVVRASIEVNASPDVVWRIIIDCAQVPRLMVNVKSCRVLDSDPNGRWDVREQVTRASILPSVRTVIRTDFDAPHTVRFHRVDGDFKVLEGEWRLESLDGGARTRVLYDCRLSAPFSAPAFMVRGVLKSTTPHMMTNLRDASQAAAEARLASSGDHRP